MLSVFLPRKFAVMRLCLMVFVFIAALTAGTAFLSPFARAAGEGADAYVVRDLTIDVRASNAVQARQQAFDQALTQAYTRLLEQVEPDPVVRAKIPVPNVAELGKLLQDFTTTNEQLSSTRYTAIYEMRFKPGRVQAFLARAKGGYQDSVAVAPVTAGVAPVSPAVVNAVVPSVNQAVAQTPTLVLPFYQAQGQPVLWTSANPLREAWQAQGGGDVPLKFALGDLDDMRVFDESHGLAYDPAQMQALLARYQVDRALIVMAIPDRSDQTGVTAMIYQASQTRPLPTYIDSVSVASSPGEAAVSLYARAVSQLRQAAGKWQPHDEPHAPHDAGTVSSLASTSAPAPMTPAALVAPDAPAQNLQVRAHFKTLVEWQQIRTRLHAAPQVDRILVSRLKTQEAHVTLIFRGSELDVLAALQTQGLLVQVAAMPLATSDPALMEPAAGQDPIVASPSVYDVSLMQATVSGVSSNQPMGM